jgi:hypothetical protein
VQEKEEPVDLRENDACINSGVCVPVGRKINLKTNFSFRTRGSSEIDLPSSVTSVGDLLRYIGGQVDFVFVDAHREELRPDVEVLINGKDLSFYPDGLKTPLREEDLVDIALMTLGGG